MQGNIHWYDFGPVIGNELSSQRPALIISSEELNRPLATVITLPMSRTMPPERHRGQHVFISESDSWASTRQIKSADQSKLGEIIGRASHDELDEAMESIVRRFATLHPPGRVNTPEGAFQVSQGTIWQLTLSEGTAWEHQAKILVLDYNAGNNMAVTVQIQDGGPRPRSPVSIPIRNDNTGETATARVHQVRSIDMGHRKLTPAGRIRSQDLDAVIARLLKLIEHPAGERPHP